MYKNKIVLNSKVFKLYDLYTKSMRFTHFRQCFKHFKQSFEHCKGIFIYRVNIHFLCNAI